MNYLANRYFDLIDKLMFHRPDSWLTKTLFRLNRSRFWVTFVRPYIIVNMGERGDYGTPLRPLNPLRVLKAK